MIVLAERRHQDGRTEVLFISADAERWYLRTGWVPAGSDTIPDCGWICAGRPEFVVSVVPEFVSRYAEHEVTRDEAVWSFLRSQTAFVEHCSKLLRAHSSA